MEMPIGVGDLGRLEQAILPAFGNPVRRRRTQALAVDAAIDHHMRNMDILRPKLARETLRK
ncbi:hypothetical protein SAMN05216466_102351 [Paraburkholderia phenazinium]|uniref:Uncharacterized protein n=1 Tax=Paraburkholderia phenazinium TaxID=60549 RepID=A0A1G7S1P1_9BURK|nr:hypothetical protein SAMN05216466_102351 [Paraburkholderia phenazinium]